MDDLSRSTRLQQMARMGATDPQAGPVDTRAALEAVAVETGTPVEILYAMGEAAGARDPREFEAVGRKVGQTLGPRFKAGESMDAVVRSFAPDDKAYSDFMAQARAINRSLYPDDWQGFGERRSVGGLLAQGAADAPREFLRGTGRAIEMAGFKQSGRALVDFADGAFGQDDIEKERDAAIAAGSTIWQETIDAVWRSLPGLGVDVGASAAGGLSGAAIGGAVAGPPGAALGGTLGLIAGAAATIFPAELSASWDAAEQGGRDVTDPQTQAEILGATVAKSIAQTVFPAGVSRTLLKPIENAANATVRNVAARAAKGAGVGALTEGTAEAVATLVDAVMFDPETRAAAQAGDLAALGPLLIERHGREALVAFGSGALLGAGVGGGVEAYGQYATNRGVEADIAAIPQALQPVWERATTAAQAIADPDRDVFLRGVLNELNGTEGKLTDPRTGEYDGQGRTAAQQRQYDRGVSWAQTEVLGLFPTGGAAPAAPGPLSSAAQAAPTPAAPPVVAPAPAPAPGAGTVAPEAAPVTPAAPQAGPVGPSGPAPSSPAPVAPPAPAPLSRTNVPPAQDDPEMEAQRRALIRASIREIEAEIGTALTVPERRDVIARLEAEGGDAEAIITERLTQTGDEVDAVIDAEQDAAPLPEPPPVDGAAAGVGATGARPPAPVAPANPAERQNRLAREQDATEPDVPAGKIRVYHSGAKGEGQTGRWVSTDRKYARDYRRGLPLFYLDLDATDPRVNNPDYPDEQGVAKGFSFSFELTPAEAAALQQVPPPPPDIRTPPVPGPRDYPVPDRRPVPDLRGAPQAGPRDYPVPPPPPDIRGPVTPSPRDYPVPERAPVPPAAVEPVAAAATAAPETAQPSSPDDGDWTTSLIRARRKAKEVGFTKAALGDSWNDLESLVARVRRREAKKQRPAAKLLGLNGRGQPLFEDDNGVRSYQDGPVTITETVGIIPGGGISIDKSRRGMDFSTQEEVDAARPPAPPVEPQVDTPAQDPIKTETPAAPAGSAPEAPAAEPPRQEAPASQNPAPGGVTPAGASDEVPAAPAAPASDYGAKNTVFTADAAAAARARLLAKRNQLNAGIDPEMIQDGITLAGFHIESGARAFADYARAMIADLGDQYRPYLRSWYEGVRYYPGFDAKGMTPASEIPDDIGEALERDAAPQGGATPPAEDATVPATETEEPADEARADQGVDQGSLEGGQPERAPDGDRRGDDRAPDGDGAETDREDAEADGDDGDGGVVGDRAPYPVDPAAERTGENPGNFLIAPDFPLGEGTDGQRLSANIRAIEIVKQLDAENRYATPDEQAALARYVGWGGLKQVFDSLKTGSTDQYGRAQARIKELLTPAEYRAATRSTSDAHYTSRTVVSAMWDQMMDMGFVGGRALEPTVGTGNFIGLMPPTLRDQIEWFAAEKDHITGAIARHLYPEATVFGGMPFEKAPFRSGSFDIAIGNPPFGSAIISSDLHPEIPPLSIHNYIIAKTGLLLREGGIMGMVVTHNFLDTPNPQARSYLARHFNFIGAIRLPNTAFKANANTEVTTDIVWFQKRAEGEPQGDLSWLETDAEGPNGTRLNGYFAANPAMMLGRPAMDGTMYGGKEEFTLHPDERDLATAMREAMRRGIQAQLPERLEALEDAVVAERSASDMAVGESALLSDGRIVVRRDDDADGNAVIEEVTETTPWGSAAVDLTNAANALEALSAAIASGDRAAGDMIADARAMLKEMGFVTQAGKQRSTPRTGVGKAANQAIATIAADLFSDAPRFGPDTQDALADLREAIEAKAIGPNRLAALRGLLSLRNNTRALLAAENASDPKMEEMRDALRAEYKRFVRAHGFINNKANDALLDGVPGVEAALEHGYKPANPRRGTPETAQRATLLKRRVIIPYEEASSAESAADGLFLSLRDRGRLDVAFIAGLTGQTPEAVVAELTGGDSPLAYLDPATDQYVVADEYLSGNLADKIRLAQRAGLDVNVRQLKAAMPAPKTQEQIKPSIRSQWLPPEIFQEFLSTMGAIAPSVTIDANIGAIRYEPNAGETPTEFGAQFRTERMSPFQIFAHMIKGKPIVIYDRISRDQSVKNETETRNATAAGERMAAEFAKWAYASPDRARRVVRAFNEKVNVVVERKFDGVRYFRPVGANPEVNLRDSQKNGAWRMIVSPSTLLHHVVGAGKTYTAIAAIMERKRLGLSRKTLVAVPNHIIGQWGRDFYHLYPGANIMVATEKDFEGPRRRKLLARIATGDYDAVIIGHSSLKFMQNSEQDVRDIMEEHIDDLQQSLEAARRDRSSGRTVAQIQQRIERYQERLAATLEKLRADNLGVDFTQMGIDNLVIDEAHEFKNLEYATAGERLVGMNAPEGSQRALDLYIKTRGLQKRRGSVGFLTGTPVSNSLVEIYTIMKYMAPATLRSMGLMPFDAWSSAFVEARNKFEWTPAMRLKNRRVMAGLTNLGPLSALYRTFADIVMRPDVEAIYRRQMEAQNERDGTNLPTRFPTPKVKGGGRRLITVPASPIHDEFTDYLVMRTEGVRANARDKDYARVDNMLWILSDARKASIDLRTIDPSMPRMPQSKVVKAGDEILRIAEKSAAQRGAQMVFADSSVPLKTATKDIEAAVREAWKKAGFDDGKARITAARAAGKSWSAQVAEAMEAVEDRSNDGALTPAQQDAIEEWMQTEGRDLAAMAQTADSGFSFYDDLKAYLVENGMPAEKIAFIHDYAKPEQKAALFAAVNEGEIRVLIGSTFKMGAGTNAQERLVGLHHIDAPWRPSDMEQREGRIIRQGNALYEADPEGFEVEIIAYATERTADVVLWQVLERKAAGIEQFLNSAADTLIEDGDSDADSYAAFMAQSTGNPVFLQKMEAEKAVQDMEAEQSTQLLMRSEAQSYVERAPRDRARYAGYLRALRGASFDAFPDAGRSMEDYRAARAAYEAAKLAHDVEEGRVRRANAMLGEGEKKQTLPKFEMSAPVLFPEGKQPDSYSAAILNVLEGLVAGLGESVGSNAESGVMRLGDIGLSFEATRLMGGETIRYTATLRFGDNSTALMGWGNSVEVKDYRNSRTLMNALMPGGVRARVDELIERYKREIADLDANLPDMERRAQAQVDVGALRKKRRELQRLRGMVRIAEAKMGRERQGRVNRFAEADTKGRDLTSAGQDDAPVYHSGDGQFVILMDGERFIAESGVAGDTATVSDETRREVWIEAQAESGARVLALVIEKTPNGQNGQRGEPTYEVQDVWPLAAPRAKPDAQMRADDDGFAGAREMRGAVESKPLLRDAMAAVNREVQRAGLGDRVTARVVYGLLGVQGGPILGRARGAEITVNAEAPDPAGTARHEIVHVLRDEALWGKPYGLFSGDEWREMVREARRDAALMDRIARAYPDLTESQRIEEAVAEMYREWAQGREARGALARLFERMRDLFRAIGAALRGEGLTGAADVMKRMERGEIGRRASVQNPDNPRISEQRDAGRELRFMNRLPRAATAAAVDANEATIMRRLSKRSSSALTDLMGGADETYNLLALVPGRALFEELGKNLPSAKAYLRSKEAMDTLRNDWHAKTDRVAQDWQKAIAQVAGATILTGGARKKAAAKALADLMHDATIAGLDPAERFRAPQRKPDMRDEDYTAYVEEMRRRYTELRARWEALPEQMKRVYVTVRETFRELANDTETAVAEAAANAMDLQGERLRDRLEDEIAEIRQQGMGPEATDRAIQEARQRFTTAVDRMASTRDSRVRKLRLAFERNRVEEPYFPLMRWGNYFATVRDDEGKVVSFSKFQRAAKQEAFAAEMREQGFTVETGVMARKNDFSRFVDPQFVADVQEIIGVDSASAAVLDAVWQRWLETLPDYSIRKSRIHRKGTPGYDGDALRAFAHQMFHGAHQLARLKHGMDLTKHLEQAQREAKAAPDPNRAGIVANEMTMRHEWIMNPTGSPWAAAATSAAFVWYLGLTPAAAIMNVTQTTIVGVPVMTAGIPGATVGRVVRQLGIALRDFAGGKGEAGASSRLTDDEKAALRDAYERGVIDKSQAHDLASVAESGVEYSGLREKVMRPISFFFHHAERMNREVTFLASYRMARDAGLTQEQAIRKASDLTWKAHFDYSNSSRPRFMQGDVGKVLFTFRNFQINMVYRLWRDIHQALHGVDEATRKEARTQLIGITASMFLHAGLTGVWGYALMTTLLGLFFEGGADELEEELKRGIAETLGVNAAGLLLKGVPGHMTGIDLSSRIGMPELWFRTPDRQLEGDELYAFWLEQLVGVVPSMASGVFRGLEWAGEGDVWRAVETAGPKALRDVMRAGRYLQEGVTTRSGEPVVEEISPMQALTQAMGFTPAEVSEQFEMNRRMRNFEERIRGERRQALRRAYEDLRDDGSLSERTVERIRRFNERNPTWIITADTVRKSVRSRESMSEQMDRGVRLTPQLDGVIRQAMAPAIYQ